MHQSVVGLASLMPACDGLSPELLDALCAAGEAALEQRLLPGHSAQALGSSFTLAAAMLAGSMALRVSQGGEKTLRAGNVSIHQGDCRETARALREGAFALLSGHLRPEGFAFQGVEL